MSTILHGLDGAALDSPNTRRALDMLRCVIYCVAPPGSQDYRPNDQEYRTVYDHAGRALDAFVALLLTPRALDELEKVDMVFDALREHGQRACLVSSEVVHAMDSFRELLPDHIRYDNRVWIQKLKLDLGNS